MKSKLKKKRLAEGLNRNWCFQLGVKNKKVNVNKCDDDKKVDDKTNKKSLFESDEVETANVKSSGKVKILNCYILKRKITIVRK